MFLYLTMTDEKTKLSQDNAITTLIIAAAYYVACDWGTFGVQFLNPVNPAIALGDGLGKTIGGQFNINSFLWLYYVVPLGGSVLAVLLFDNIFKKAAEKFVEQENAAQNSA